MSHRFSSHSGVSARHGHAYVDEGSDYGTEYDADAAARYDDSDPQAYDHAAYDNAAYDERYAEPAAPHYAVVDALNDHCDARYPVDNRPTRAARATRAAQLGEWAQRYAARLEHYTRLAPYNWFNLYDFWHRRADTGAARREPAALRADA